MITPTVGRVVWFTPSAMHPGIYDRTQPLAAIVTYVHSDRMVNLVVFDHNGNATGCTSVTLLQDDDQPNTAGYFCQWMPYQKGQAAKYEEFEKAKSES